MTNKDKISNNSAFEFSKKQKIYFIFKRLFDIVFSIIGIIGFIILSIIIKIIYLFNGDNKTIIYKHTRVGKDGKLFTLYKFRTMVEDADDLLKDLLKDSNIKDEWNENHKIKKDPRITKVGYFLRKTSLDEFPQFINVLKGDMSVIGPRPLVEGELESKNGLPLYRKIRPGITGWWAVNGRNSIAYAQRLELEYYYVKHCSLHLDILCFIKTLML